MSATTTTAFFHPTHRQVRRHPNAIRGVILALIVGALVIALVKATHGFAPETAAGAAVAAQHVPEFARRELPREWRWEPKRVAFDHMYARKGSPRLDWIREPSSRSRGGN